MILPDKKLLFIHIPKTAGSSIAAALFQNEQIEYRTYIKLPEKVQQKYMAGLDLKHAPAFVYKSKLDNYDDYYKFAIIRCPYERFYSQYNWYINHAKNISMENFASLIKSKESRQSYSQKYYVTEENSNKIIVNDIFQISQIEKVFEKFGLQPQRKKVSNKKRKDKKEISAFVNELYGEDIDFFEFDDNGIANKNVTIL